MIYKKIYVYNYLKIRTISDRMTGEMILHPNPTWSTTWPTGLAFVFYRIFVHIFDLGGSDIGRVQMTLLAL